MTFERIQVQHEAVTRIEMKDLVSYLMSLAISELLVRSKGLNIKVMETTLTYRGYENQYNRTKLCTKFAKSATIS